MSEGSVKRFTMEKLVRDKSPARLQELGFVVRHRTMDHHEFIEQLKRKLHEETEEVTSATTGFELAEEMADVLEVLHALSQAIELPFHQVEEKRLKKKEERGGFDARVFVHYVDADESNPHVTYFASNPNRYPTRVSS